MIPGRIVGATRFIGAPRDWQEELDGHCGTLPVLDVIRDDRAVMQSVWTPNLEELAALNAGASVLLEVGGYVHPVVAVGVTYPPDAET